jgi:hypothetical protein
MLEIGADSSFPRFKERAASADENRGQAPALPESAP